MWTVTGCCFFSLPPLVVGEFFLEITIRFCLLPKGRLALSAIIRLALGKFHDIKDNQQAY